MVTLTEVAKQYAALDGQMDWDSLPDLMKMEYEQTVERVLQAATEASTEDRENG